MVIIDNGYIVSIRYSMKNGRGEVLENTLNSNPVSYLQGAAAILPLLQQQLAGLKKGDRKTVYLKAAERVTTDDFVFDVIIDEVRKAWPEELLLGYPVQAQVQPCEADCDCYKHIPSAL